MSQQDIATVQAIERQVFVSPWPKNAYTTELTQNRHASYFVLKCDAEVVGYAGLWKVVNEAHVTTIGVRSSDQGKGYGKALFAALISRAYELGAYWITLEVRSTNMPAIALYESFGFKAIGRRRGYYTDNGEDAIVMWSDSMHSPRFKEVVTRRFERIDVSGLGAVPPLAYPGR